MANILDDKLNNPDITIALLYQAMVKRGLRQGDKENDNFSKTLLSSTNISKELKDKLDSLSEEEFIQYAIRTLDLLKNSKEYAFSSANLTQLVNQLLELKDQDILYDLGSGYGDFLIYSHMINQKDNKHVTYIGSDIDYYSTGIAKLLNIIFNYNIDIRYGNALESETIKCDKGYSFPPLALRTLGGNYNTSLLTEQSLNNRISSEWLFADKLLAGLNKNGKAIVLMSNGALYNSNDIEFRNSLISKGYIEGIIELPSKTVEAITASLSLVIFSFNNKTVKALDALNMALDSDSIYNAYQTAKEYTFQELIKSNNIVPSSLVKKDYLSQLKTNTTISDVAIIFNACQYTMAHFKNDFVDEETGVRILTSKDIEDGYVNWKSLPFIKLNDNKILKYVLYKGDIIITSKSSKIKIAVVNKELEDKVIVTGGMLVIRPDLNKVDPTFIKMYLDSIDGQIALSSIQKGQVITTINANDLGQLYLPDKPLDKQKELAKEYNDKLNKIIELKHELYKAECNLACLYDNNN